MHNCFGPLAGWFLRAFIGLGKARIGKKAIGRKLLSWDKLITMITEVEAIINTRPLTYVYSDFYQVLH